MVAPLNRTFERYGETMRFGRLDAAQPLETVKLLIEHDPERPVGYATSAEADAAGLHMSFALPDMQPGADALAMLRARLRDGFSIGVEIRESAADPDTGELELSGVVREVSLVAVPVFNESRAAEVAASAQLSTFTTNTEVDTMPATSPVEAAASTFNIADTPEYAELATRVGDLEAGGRGAHPLARYSSLAELILAGTAPDAGRVSLALADNTFEAGANAGVNPPAWLARVFGILERRRVVVEAFGGPSSLPDAGMTVTWPYFDGDLATFVGEQLAQKTDITSAAVDIKAASAPVKTYAGGADNALQLIERSSPSFLESWGRIMMAAYGLVTDAAFSTAVEAAAATLAGAYDSPSALKSWLFEASDMVDEATGAPAAFALAAPDVFKAIGTMENLEAPEYGTVNTPGTASAASLRIDVSGLPVLKARSLPAGALIASNSEAATFGEDGPSFIDQLAVSKLGRDSAIYGYGASMVHIAAGVVKLTAPLPRKR